MKRKAVLFHGSAVIDDAIVLLQAFKQGRIDEADSPLTGPLIEIIGDELYRRKPHLWLPADIIKKILACLPARECWRIGTQLSHAYNQWAKSVINIYRARIEFCQIDEDTGAEKDFSFVCKTELRFCHNVSMLEIRFTGFQEQIRHRYTSIGITALVNCNGKPLRHKPTNPWSPWEGFPRPIIERFEKKIVVIIE